MSTVAKILVVVNLVLAGAFLASASNFLGQEDDWKVRYERIDADYKQQLQDKNAELAAAKSENSNLLSQNRTVQNQLAEVKKEAQEVRQQNDLLKESFNQASTQLTTATAALKAAQETIQQQRTLIDGLNQERAALAQAKASAIQAKEAAVRNLNEKEVQFGNLLEAKQALEARIEELKNQLRSAQLTAETAVAKGGAGDVPMDQPAHLGQILDVDNEANIAVISLGAEDGVRAGFRYTVSRGSEYVAMIEITDVQAKQSAGRAIKGLQKAPIQRGDRVMTR